jgi:ABC-2 type transport system ATP-binding protein
VRDVTPHASNLARFAGDHVLPREYPSYSSPQTRAHRDTATMIEMQPGPPNGLTTERMLSVAESVDRSPSSPVVSCRGLTKRYHQLVAVDELTFSLEPGTVTAFLGPNGAGKTTTLRLLLGLAEPSAGEALVFGRRYRELEQPIRLIGAVLESSDFHPARRGRDHLRALALAAGLPLSRVEDVLDLVELRDAAGRRVHTYSLGMRQRLGLAAALLGDPELLILDEPANGLDPAGVRWLRTFLQSLGVQGRTVLVSSHLLAEVAQTVDRVLIIDHGRLLAGGRLADLTRNGRTLEDVYLELTAGDLR